jgi:hypothetical protein
MRVDADDISPGDSIGWSDVTYTVEQVRSDGSLRHVRTAEGLSLVFHALEQVELVGRGTHCGAA